MNIWLRVTRVLIALGIVYAVTNVPIAFSEANSGSVEIEIDAKTNLLTLKAHDAPLSEVIQRIGELAGFKTVVVAATGESRLVTVSFTGMPITEAVEHLTRDTNRIVFYQSSDGSGEHNTISQLWFLGFSDSPSDEVTDTLESFVSVENLQQENSNTRSMAALRLSTQASSVLSAKDEKERIRLRLIQLLQEDQDALVRARAAIALGALGDEKAVTALESALLDRHASIRAQAINALGQIGGERATRTLGNILLYGSTNTTDRIMAAQALWKHDTEEAREYLRIGATDIDEQVRLASSTPPSAPRKSRDAEQLGAEQTQ
ncbi:MAG: HEAT repeat domain-containing protein [Arenicellales bacterium]